MTPLRPLRLVLLASLAFTACGPRHSTVPAGTPTVMEADSGSAVPRRLGEAIDVFEGEPTSLHEANVKKALAELDGEIADLEANVDVLSGDERMQNQQKKEKFSAYREEQFTRFNVLRAKAALTPSPEVRDAAQKIEEKAKDLGDRLEDGAKRAGDALEEAGRKAKDAVKEIRR